MDDRTPEKKQQLLAALDRGMVMVHLDARRPGVVVPAEFRTESHLRLNLSYRFEPSDLSVGEWGLRSTLSFSGDRFTVAIPWSAVFAITSHASREFWMFPEDMPPELTRSSGVGRPSRSELAPRGAPLREVSLEPAQAEETAPDQGQPRGRGHLRVVK
ncbi:MAG: ClpXP protease specificity-enhancing factor SspB [Myxococcaceae bacterium]